MQFFARSGCQLPSNRRLALIGVVVICITIAAAGLAIWDLRQDAMKSYEQEMTNLGVALAEQTSRTLQSVDLVLNEIEKEVDALQ